METSEIWTPPTLWSTKPHFRTTRKGKVLKSVSERYLRDDLGLGFLLARNEQSSRNNSNLNDSNHIHLESTQQLLSQLVSTSSSTTPSSLSSDSRKTPQIVICDTNILLHNLDLLEHASGAISNIVIPQTSLEECKKHSLSAYNRTINLLREADSTKRCVVFFPNEYHVETQPKRSNHHHRSENKKSANDVNDEKIRKVAEFYGWQCKGANIKIILLTDDAQCRALAKIESEKNEDCLYVAQSARQHVQLLEKEDPTLNLSDLVAQFNTVTSTKTSTSSTSRFKTNKPLFSPHLSTSDLLLGVKSGKYYQGVLRTKRSSGSDHNNPSYFQCYVTVRRGEERIAVSITNRDNVNRAVDGDVVAIQLHSVDSWGMNESSDRQRGLEGEEKTFKNQSMKTGIAEETAEPSIRDEENIQETLSIPTSIKNSNSDKVHVEGEKIVQCQPTGKVIGIVRRNFRQNYCGSIYDSQHVKSPTNESSTSTSTNPETQKDPKVTYLSETRASIVEQWESEHADGSHTCVFFAVDPKIPPILIRTTQKERLVGKRILTTIDSWPVESPYPLGHYVKTIGEAGLKDVETEVLLHEHDIPCDPFPAKVLACLPPSDYKIDIENSPGRLDLRHLPVLSIDPPGCKDIDDALHCTLLPNGNYQVGVHIADVTHYVKPNTEIDKEAANRSTSTYLVNKRLDMLPSLLTTDLCSLKGNVDRFAFSVLWEVTPEAEILNVDFRKSIIHSIAALTYQQAQALIDLPDKNELETEDVQAGAVKRLVKLARKFRKRRIDAGALTLASPEVKFVLDSESLNPTDVQSYALFEANALVEEFMLLANVTVGKKILRHYPTLCVLRRHPAPNRTMFTSLVSKAKSKGFEIDIEDSKRLADSLDAAILPSDPYFNKLLRILSTRCMAPAQYFCSGEYTPSDWHHYGLAAPVYTHFTSPIRRYADVCVHRLLAASIGVDPLPTHLSSKSYLHDLTMNMNKRHRSAQLAGRASVQLHTLIFFSSVKTEAKEEEAYILDVDASETLECPVLTVIVPQYGIEGRVLLKDIKTKNKSLVYEPENHRLVYKSGNDDDSRVCLQVFDKVKVKIWVKTAQENQKELILDLIHPQLNGKLPKTIKTTQNTLSEKKRPFEKKAKESKRKRRR